MGMYTELNFNARLEENTPKSVIDILGYMMRRTEERPELPPHEFFSCDRWGMLFTMDSYYFDADTHSILRYDDIAEQYFLNIQSNLKNYDSEISKFIDFIMPYVDAMKGDFLGYSRYEEDTEPTLIYKT